MTPSIAASDRKKTEDGTMMPPPKAESNPMTVADRPKAQTLTTATTEGLQTS
jgi:hypothetical protein